MNPDAHRPELPRLVDAGRAHAALVFDGDDTCFYVDRTRRWTGIADAALAGALALIADAGGGVVEGYPHDTGGEKVSASFLYSATRSMFERHGFVYDRPKGSKNCVMILTVPAR